MSILQAAGFADRSLEQTCQEVASQYGLQLAAYEASSPADSQTCQSILAAYLVDLEPAVDFVPATTTIDGPATTPSAVITITSTSTGSPSTITSHSTQTLTYTIGAGESTAIRTIVVTITTTDIVTFEATLTVDAPVARNTSLPVTTGRNNTTASATTRSSLSSFLAAPASLTSSLASSTTSSQSISTVSTSTLSSTSPSSSSSQSACVTAAPPAATQNGVVSGCTQWHVAVPGEYCALVASRYGISVATFMAWNPAVDPPSCPSMLAGDAYCVATCGGSLAPAAASTSSVSSTLSSVGSPSTLSTSTLSTTLASSASSSSSSTGSSTASAASSTATSSGVDVYKTYTGDGSVADGWPAMSQWVDFDYM